MDMHSWIVWENVTGDRQRNGKEEAALRLTLIFLLYRCILHDSLICDGAWASVGVHTSACPEVFGLSLCTYYANACECLTNLLCSIYPVCFISLFLIILYLICALSSAQVGLPTCTISLNPSQWSGNKSCNLVAKLSPKENRTDHLLTNDSSEINHESLTEHGLCRLHLTCVHVWRKCSEIIL